MGHDIDELLGEISRKLGAPSGNERTVSPDTEDGTERELKLYSAAAEFRRLMERVLNKGECWVFEIDPKNRFIITSDIKKDASVATPCMMAKACLVDTIFRANTAELKKLGWTVDSGDGVKGALKGALLGAGAFYANFFDLRRAHDYLSGIEANRSWMVTSPKDTLVEVAADLARALRSVAPEAKTIIARRQEAETQA